MHDFLATKRKTQQPITYTTYHKICQTYLLPAFGSIRVRDLSPKTIRQWIQSLTLTAKTIRNVLIPLRAILEEAVNDDILEKNPLYGDDYKNLRQMATGYPQPRRLSDSQRLGAGDLNVAHHIPLAHLHGMPMRPL